MYVAIVKDAVLVCPDPGKAPEGSSGRGAILFTQQTKSEDFAEYAVPKIISYKSATSSPDAGLLDQGPSVVDGLVISAVTNERGHVDLVVKETGSEDVSVLFSERGDVSNEETAAHQLSIVKNKHRAAQTPDSVITWPWPTQLFHVTVEGARKVEPEQASKEWSDQHGPIQRVGDTLVAAMHKAFTTLADDYAYKGLVSQEERIQMSSVIGDMLGLFNTAVPEEVRERAVSSYWMPVPSEILGDLKALDLVPEDFDGTWKPGWNAVWKDKEGNWCWAGITSCSIMDKHKEYFSPKAMEWALKAAKLLDYRGPLRYKHIPGLDGATTDVQIAVKGWLFEKGKFLDTPIGIAMRQKLQNEPGWQLSAGLLYGAKDLLHDMFYRRALLFERSMTKNPAVDATAAVALSIKGEIVMSKALTAQDFANVAKELDMQPEEIEALYTTAVANGGVQGRTKEELVTAFKEALKAAAAPEDPAEYPDDDVDDEEAAKKARKEFFAQLNSLDNEAKQEIVDFLTAPETDPAMELEVQQAASDLTPVIEALSAQTKAIEALGMAVASMAQNQMQQHAAPQVDTRAQTKEARQAAAVERLAEALLSTPRSQAPLPAPALKDAPAQIVVDPANPNEAILQLVQKFSALETQLKQAPAGIPTGSPFQQGNPIYDAYTSTRMNSNGPQNPIGALTPGAN